MVRRPPESKQGWTAEASDGYKRQHHKYPQHQAVLAVLVMLVVLVLRPGGLFAQISQKKV